jgi:hypothetical protein
MEIGATLTHLRGVSNHYPSMQVERNDYLRKGFRNN